MTDTASVAAAEVAKVLAVKSADFVGEVIGENVKNLVGLFGADWVLIKREENMEILRHKKDERLKARGIRIGETEPVALSVAIPLIQAASDESREEVVDLWARLLASALDPRRKNRVSRRFIEIVKQLEPVEALAFQDIYLKGQTTVYHLTDMLKLNPTEIDVAVENLVGLKLVRPIDKFGSELGYSTVQITARGTELGRLFAD